jgi:hypothetical protein
LYHSSLLLRLEFCRSYCSSVPLLLPSDIVHIKLVVELLLASNAIFSLSFPFNVHGASLPFRFTLFMFSDIPLTRQTTVKRLKYPLRFFLPLRASRYISSYSRRTPVSLLFLLWVLCCFVNHIIFRVLNNNYIYNTYRGYTCYFCNSNIRTAPQFQIVRLFHDVRSRNALRHRCS